MTDLSTPAKTCVRHIFELDESSIAEGTEITEEEVTLLEGKTSYQLIASISGVDSTIARVFQQGHGLKVWR